MLGRFGWAFIFSHEHVLAITTDKKSNGSAQFMGNGTYELITLSGILVVLRDTASTPSY